MNRESNDIINKFLLVGDKFLPELHLWDPKVKKYPACGPFTKHEERIQSFMKDGRLSHLYKNEWDKACFQHDAAYNKYKDLKNSTQSDTGLKNKAYKIAVDKSKNSYERLLASMVYKLFNERSNKVLSGSGIENKQLADELHKPIMKKFKRRKVPSSYKDNIWGVHLADMSLIHKFNKEIKYLLCDLDLFSRFTWVAGIKDKKGVSIVKGFKKIIIVIIIIIIIIIIAPKESLIK